MRLLVIKMSSLGDLVHTLPAITDAMQALPDLQIDWVVEEGFAAVPALHAGIDRVIPIAIRRWRGQPLSCGSELKDFFRSLRQHEYDLVLDAQGLLKSAIVAKLARGPVAGLDWHSARESIASLLYNRHFAVGRAQHAVLRLRQLFASALGYDFDANALDFGLCKPVVVARQQIMLLHGTTWATKHWPLRYWQRLAERVLADGYDIVIPHGNAIELSRAGQISGGKDGITILPRGNIDGLFSALCECAGVVTVDSGLGHLATAANIPLVGLYGATNPELTGPAGAYQQTLVSDHLPCIPCMKRECRFPDVGSGIHPPCFEPLTPELVWDRLKVLMDQRQRLIR